MRALIVEPGHTRGALAAARALHAAGWAVGVATTARPVLAARSRCVERRHQGPAPATDPDGFVEAIAAAVRKGGYEVVLPGADAEALALSARRDEIGAVVPHPAHERLARGLDKLLLTEAARAAGLRTPETLPAGHGLPSTGGGVAIVKPRLHAQPGRARAPARMEAMLAHNAAEIARRIEEIRRAGGDPIVQEVVGGRLLAYTAVADRDARVVAQVQQIAERTWPLEAGISARARTAEPDEALGERVAALLRELGWFGLAQLQFVVPDGGEPHLIDLNPRLYGSLGLAVGAGVNLPAIWAAVATSRERPLPADARPGVVYQWGEGDLRAALARRKRASGELREWARVARASVDGVWSAADPGPALRYAADVGRRAARSRARRRRAGALIAISGLDGSGKSSQAESLAGALRERGLPAAVAWTSVAEHPPWLRAFAAAAKHALAAVAGRLGHAPTLDDDTGAPLGSDDPGKAIRRESSALTFAWSTLLMTRLALKVARSTWPKLLRGETVVCDRYTLDALAHLRYQYGEERGYRLQQAILRALSPAPRRSFLLEVSPLTAARRAPEYTAPQNSRRAAIYADIAARVGARVVDGERAPDEIGAELAREALASLNGQVPPAPRRAVERSYSSS